jgi:hypothetical protein
MGVVRLFFGKQTVEFSAPCEERQGDQKKLAKASQIPL